MGSNGIQTDSDLKIKTIGFPATSITIMLVSPANRLEIRKNEKPPPRVLLFTGMAAAAEVIDTPNFSLLPPASPSSSLVNPSCFGTGPLKNWNSCVHI